MPTIASQVQIAGPIATVVAHHIPQFVFVIKFGFLVVANATARTRNDRVRCIPIGRTILIWLHHKRALRQGGRL